MRQRGRAADPGIELPGELSPEILSRQVLAHARFETLERRDQRLGHIAAAIRTEAATGVGETAGELGIEQLLLLSRGESDVGVHVGALIIWVSRGQAVLQPLGRLPRSQ